MRKPKSKQRIVLRTIIPEIMLEVFFCNVGDGDAILLREFREGIRDYNILVDAGRPYLEPKQGSLRKEAIYYLKARGIDHLDRMILTHLHIDHIGGALRILNAIPTESLTVLNLPPQDAEWVAQSFESADKAVNGLCYALNIFRDITERAKELGCCLETAFPGEIALSDRLTMTTYLPRNEIILRQQSVFNRLYRNEPVDYDECYRVSKERNHSSLMLGFIYAGRHVLLTGDRYGFDWENEPIPSCDILKLPHHGDRKSITEPLLIRLHPRYAVVSCQNDPNARKERPSAETFAFVQKTVPVALCTENRAMPIFDAATYNGIRFEISDEGEITCEIE